MNKSKKILVFAASAYFLIIILIFAAFFLSFITQSILISNLAAAIIAGLNFFLGFKSINWAYNKSNEIFLATIFGGMIIRLMITLALVIICLKLLEIKPLTFILVILFFYIFFLIVEIIYLNLKKK